MVDLAGEEHRQGEPEEKQDNPGGVVAQRIASLSPPTRRGGRSRSPAFVPSHDAEGRRSGTGTVESKAHHESPLHSDHRKEHTRSDDHLPRQENKGSRDTGRRHSREPSPHFDHRRHARLSGYRGRRDDDEEHGHRRRRDDIEEHGFRRRRDDDQEHGFRRKHGEDVEHGFRRRHGEDREHGFGRRHGDDQEHGFRSKRDNDEQHSFRRRGDDGEDYGSRRRRDGEEHGVRRRRDDEEHGSRRKRDDEEHGLRMRGSNDKEHGSKRGRDGDEEQAAKRSSSSYDKEKSEHHGKAELIDSRKRRHLELDAPPASRGRETSLLAKEEGEADTPPSGFLAEGHREKERNGGTDLSSHQLPQRQQSSNDELPKLYSIHRAKVHSLRPFGVFVRLEGFFKQGLVHLSHLSDHEVTNRDDSDELKVQAIATIAEEGDQVWVKVISLKDEGGSVKIGCSLKLVSQSTGQDLDPNNVKLDQQQHTRVDRQEPQKVTLDAVYNVVCSRCGCHGHMKTECYSAGKVYDILPEVDDKLLDQPTQAAPNAKLSLEGVAIPGLGRGRAMVLPAWMTHADKVKLSQTLESESKKEKVSDLPDKVATVEEAMAFMAQVKEEKKHKKHKRGGKNKHKKREADKKSRRKGRVRRNDEK